MGPAKYSFSKSEKLIGKKKIGELFRRGSFFYLDNFQIRHQLATSDSNHHQVIISVPKRTFKRAVDRNLLKRRIREAYRLNKHLLDNCKPLFIGFVYLSKEILTFQEIQSQLIQCLNRLGSINEVK